MTDTATHTQTPAPGTTSPQAVCLVYSTFPTQASAEAAARDLVPQNLVACANILPGMVSFYQWEGALERGEEVVMVLKTTQARVQDVICALAALHPYEVPAIVVLPASGGLPAYLDWVANAVTPPATP